VPDGKKDIARDPMRAPPGNWPGTSPIPTFNFMDGIADLKFTMAARAESEKPKTTVELVDWVRREYEAAPAMRSRSVGSKLLNRSSFSPSLTSVFIWDF